MPKTILSICMLCSFFLINACTPNETSFQESVEEQPAQAVAPILQPADNEVFVSRNLDFGRINPRVYIKLEGEDSVEAFREADRTKHELMGMMDVRHPDFDLVFNSGGEIRELHLWLPGNEEDRGMVTEIDKTGTGYQLTPKSTQVLRGLIEDYRYDYEQAVDNGDIVQILGKMYNFDKWEDFLTDIEQSRPASVQRVGYTIEGDPIFDNLDFDGQSIYYVSDNTMDRFGLPKKEFDTCEKVITEPIPAEHNTPGIVYRLDGCSGTNGGLNESFWFAIPDEAEKIEPNG